jgi:hypothetical protein
MNKFTSHRDEIIWLHEGEEGETVLRAIQDGLNGADQAAMVDYYAQMLTSHGELLAALKGFGEQHKLAWGSGICPCDLCEKARAALAKIA